MHQQVRVGGLSSCSSVTELPLPDRTTASPATRKLLAEPERGGQLRFNLAWKESGDGGSASGRKNVALAVAYADELLIFSPRQQQQHLADNANTDSSDGAAATTWSATPAVGDSGTAYPCLSPIVHQTVTFSDAPKDSGTLNSRRDRAPARKKPASPMGELIPSINGLVWLHRQASIPLAASTLQSGNESNNATVSKGLMLSAAGHDARTGELQNGPLLVFDTSVAARSVTHLSPEVRAVKEVPLCCTTLDHLAWRATRPLPHYHPDFILEYVSRCTIPHHTTPQPQQPQQQPQPQTQPQPQPQPQPQLQSHHTTTAPNGGTAPSYCRACVCVRVHAVMIPFVLLREDWPFLMQVH